MKKTILILATLALFLSCNSEDNRNKDIFDFNNFNGIRGVWYYSKVIQPDGEIKDYIGSCPTKRDQVSFYPGVFYHNIHGTDCTFFEGDAGCYSPVFLENNVIAGCNAQYNGTYTITGKTLRIDFPEVRWFGYAEKNFESAKGLILTRE